MSTVIDLYKHRAAVGYKSAHGVDEKAPLPEQLVGLELEIEGFGNQFERQFGGFVFDTDGSLRPTAAGEGIEAISKPIATKHVPAILKAFYAQFQITGLNYSDRCSTHVHFNVQPLTFEQLTTVCLIYQTVERLLFQYVGHNRGEGIYCVPWYQSNLSYNIVNKLEQGGSHAHDVCRAWQKYSALNLIPVTSQGTVEFRHLHGTCDVGTITEWIYILSKIFQYALNTPLQTAKDSILNMNTVSNYHEWLASVFGVYTQCLQKENFEVHLATGVIDSKLMLSKAPAKRMVYHGAIEARNWDAFIERDEPDVDEHEARNLAMEQLLRNHRATVAAAQAIPATPVPDGWMTWGQVRATHPGNPMVMNETTTVTIAPGAVVTPRRPVPRPAGPARRTPF